MQIGKKRPKAVAPCMSDLPAFRMDYENIPFTVTGIDLFGPLFIKQGSSRLKR